MDKKFIKEHNLTEAVKRFRQINEYTFFSRPMSEDDDDEQSDDMPDKGDDKDAPDIDKPSKPDDVDSKSDNTPPKPDMGGPDDEGKPEPGDGMLDLNDESDSDDTSDDDLDGLDDVSTEPMQDDDEVIDVDDLTNAQEATDGKVDQMTQHLGVLLQAVASIKQSLDDNNAKIADLRQDFERRNPTETEKLNIRTQDSYPFSENPGEYWEQKGVQKPNYQISTDNKDVTQSKEYTLTQNDINKISNGSMVDVGDTFDYKLDLRKALDF